MVSDIWLRTILIVRKEGRKEMFYLMTHSTHFYLRLHGVRHFYLRLYGRKEGNVFFNDALNTFLFTVIWKEGNVLFNNALKTFLFTVIWKEGRKCLFNNTLNTFLVTVIWKEGRKCFI